ncbi:hypothetical protein BHU09_09280 [Tannerella sp. oral taxon 808]|nr:hypothetical protein BHU09_09280 [Tannerella sp. oral taxon 808]
MQIKVWRCAVAIHKIGMSQIHREAGVHPAAIEVLQHTAGEDVHMARALRGVAHFNHTRVVSGFVRRVGCPFGILLFEVVVAFHAKHTGLRASGHIRQVDLTAIVESTQRRRRELEALA